MGLLCGEPIALGETFHWKYFPVQHLHIGIGIVRFYRSSACKYITNLTTWRSPDAAAFNTIYLKPGALQISTHTSISKKYSQHPHQGARTTILHINMSLPPELRVICNHLSSTPVAELPRLTPTLLRQVLRCHVPLSSPVGTGAKAEASASAVLVHKLKTQLSTLLNGKSPEGRFTAVVLIKAVVEVGGWEVLRGTESWVRGLLSILGVSNCIHSTIRIETDHLEETRFKCYQRTLYHSTYKNILHDPSVSDSGSRDHYSYLAHVRDCLFESHLIQAVQQECRGSPIPG